MSDDSIINEIRHQPKKPKAPYTPEIIKPEQTITKHFYPTRDENNVWAVRDWDKIRDKESEYNYNDEIKLSKIVKWAQEKGIDLDSITVVSFIEDNETSGIGFRHDIIRSGEEFQAEMEKYKAEKRRQHEALQEYKQEMKDYEIAVAEWNLWKAQKDLAKVVAKNTSDSEKDNGKAKS